jgi:hypothetical protein
LPVEDAEPFTPDALPGLRRFLLTLLLGLVSLGGEALFLSPLLLGRLG